MKNDKIFGSCIYAIRHSKTLTNYIGRKSLISIEEKRIWKTAKKLLNESKLKNKIMPIIFAPAENTTYLYGWAELKEVEFNKDKRTIYQIMNLKKFNKKYFKTVLTKIDGNSIDEKLRYSYVLCKTPFQILNSVTSSKSSHSDRVASDINTPPDSVEATVNRIIRDTEKTKKLKKTYDYRCQICGIDIKLGKNKYYIEVHHVKPLGGSHKGNDNENNMIVLCPNHHALFDYGIPRFLSNHQVEIYGKIYSLKSNHLIDNENIGYYNKFIRIVKV